MGIINNKKFPASLFFGAFVTFLLVSVVSASAAIFPTVQIHNLSQCDSCNITLDKLSVNDAHVNYTIFVPDFDWNTTSNKTILSSNVYARMEHATGGDFMDFDNFPTELAHLGFNFTFNITNLNEFASDSVTTINISSNLTVVGTNQTFVLMGKDSFSFFEPFSNQTVTFIETFPCTSELQSDGTCFGTMIPLVFELNTTTNTYEIMNLSTNATLGDPTFNVSQAWLETEFFNRNISINVTNSSTTSWRAFRITYSFIDGNQSDFGGQEEDFSFREPSPVFITSQTSLSVDLKVAD